MFCFSVAMHGHSTSSTNLDPLPSLPRGGGTTCVSALTGRHRERHTYCDAEEACGRTMMKVAGTWEAAEQKEGGWGAAAGFFEMCWIRSEEADSEELLPHCSVICGMRKFRVRFFSRQWAWGDGSAEIRGWGEEMILHRAMWVDWGRRFNFPTALHGFISSRDRD
jgi:hypothetical protein